MSRGHWSNEPATVPEQPRGDHASHRDGLQLVVLNGEGSFTRLLASGVYVLGRGAEADVSIAAAGLSRQHARLTLGDTLTIEDCDSRNGTFVRGQRLAPGTAVNVSAGEPIALGQDVTCIIHGSAPRASGGAASLMAQLDQIVERVAKVDVPILIQGETGVGKDVLARRIHAASKRAGGPFVPVNCGAISETLADSELFGYERGAFTGAQGSKPGLFDTASGGTLFLDEIGDMPASVQVKLLRVLETGEQTPVGATRPRLFDARFIAATHHDLKADAERGAFRRDLYHRIDGVTLYLPPLRERLDELPALAGLFCKEAAEELGIAPPELTSEAVARLASYGWPGNVRELRQVMRRAVLMSSGGALAIDQLPVSSQEPAPAAVAATLKRDVKELERARILEALEACAGNQTRAASMLGISRSTLVTRMEEYGVPRPRKR